MHEFTLVQNLMDALEACERPGTPRRVALSVGRLVMVHEQLLREAFEILAADGPWATAGLQVEYEEPVLRCGPCGHATPWPAERCEACERDDIEVEGGSEILIKEVEFDVDDTGADGAEDPGQERRSR